MRGSKNIISKVIATAALDATLEPHIPIVEIAGNNHMLIENHISVIGYTSEIVSVKVNFGCIHVSGNNLIISKLTNEQLVIRGCIESIVLKHTGGM